MPEPLNIGKSPTAEYLYRRCLHLAPFGGPPGYATNATQHRGIQSQMAGAAQFFRYEMDAIVERAYVVIASSDEGCRPSPWLPDSLRAVPTVYNARDAGNYERLMGRWSRRLAPLFIEHAGIADGEEVLEIGCGTGSLTFALAEVAGFARLTAIDQSEVYLAAAQAKNRDPRIHLEPGDGCALRFADASFDRTLSMLVLPSVLPEPEQMVAEMRRVTRPGGIVAAAFWDTPGGTPHQRMFWDTAAALDDSAGTARDSTLSRPIYAAGALPRIWADAGLVEIDERSLMIRMDFVDYADYWEPFASGEGGLGAYVATLDDARRNRLERHLRAAYLTGRPDGERSFVAVALSCRGLVPNT